MLGPMASKAAVRKPRAKAPASEAAKRARRAPVAPADVQDRRYLGSQIRLSESNGTPLYLQLANQLKYLIATDAPASARRLPSARHLADHLSINRNTVLGAYALLRRDGYVTANRGAGTVVLAAPGTRDPYRDAVLRPEVLSLVEELVARAATAGIPVEQLAALVVSRGNATDERPPLRVCFVECNEQSISHFAGPIEREFGVQVDSVLLDQVGSAAARGDLRDIDCVVTTFYHFSTARKALHQAGVQHELFAIGVRPHVSILEELERLPRGTIVGVVYFGPDDGLHGRAARAHGDGHRADGHQGQAGAAR